MELQAECKRVALLMLVRCTMIFRDWDNYTNADDEDETDDKIKIKYLIHIFETRGVYQTQSKSIIQLFFARKKKHVL